MRTLLLCAFLVCAASLVFAQGRRSEDLCNPAWAIPVHRADGVIEQQVILSGKWGNNEATAYLPNKEIADAGIVFSHSAIHADSGASADLLGFALRLAHAGAAVIVPHRTLLWPATDSRMNREGAVVVCAEHWLIDHAKVVNDGKGFVQSEDGKETVLFEAYAYSALGSAVPH